MSLEERIAGARTSYERSVLNESDADPDPFVPFRSWLDAAVADERTIEPNAMTVATVAADGRPSARVVLLRGFDERGVVFFTNYESRKSREIAATGHASVVFWWGALEKQIRIDGEVVRLDAAESDAYFAKRPRGHRIGAWASAQSATIPDRATVERQIAETEERFCDRDVDRPSFWGGFRVVPHAFEFWQGRKNRVHDRLLYERGAHGRWTIARLSP